MEYYAAVVGVITWNDVPEGELKSIEDNIRRSRDVVHYLVSPMLKG
jgi:hypothetical protein